MSDAATPPRPPSNQTLLFVGGAMRSGTTVIHRALCTAKNSNPYISESWFLHDLFTLYGRNLSRFDVRAEDQFGDISKLTEIVAYDLWYYVNLVSSRYGDPEVLILKHPELTRHFHTIKRMAPAAKFLVIVRDPRDVISSIKDVNLKHRDAGVWSPTANFETMKDYCKFYAGYYNKLFDQKALFGEDLMFVRYEDVIAAPAEVFSKIGAFCGAVFEPGAVGKYDPAATESKNLARDERLKDPFSGAFWSDLYTKDLSPQSIGRHTRNLSAAEVAEIERLLGSMGTAFGYW